MVKKRIFQWFTFSLMILTAVMAYMNVISDDKDVRELAKKTAVEAAGCGETCKMSGFRGERGMIHETIEYDFAPQGHYVVKCHRTMIAIGDYMCVVTEGHSSNVRGSTLREGGPHASSSGPTPPPSR